MFEKDINLDTLATKPKKVVQFIKKVGCLARPYGSPLMGPENETTTTKRWQSICMDNKVDRY